MSAPPCIERVAVVAHDAGGARALAPVAQELRRRGRRVHAIVAGPAEQIWMEAQDCDSILRLPDATPSEVLGSALSRLSADALLSAAGLYNRIEHTARLAARRLGLPIVAVLDSWNNYRERFERLEGDRSVPSFPDRVCVIDELTRQGMLRAGFPTHDVYLTGHPELERTAAACSDFPDEQQRALRRSAGLSESGLTFAFFSDPFYSGPRGEFYSGVGAIMLPDGRGLFGYTVRDILPVFLEELDEALTAERSSTQLVVCPHPAEHDGVLGEILGCARLTRLRAVLLRGGPAIRWIQLSDAVIGMMSIALLQAAVAGKPSLSVQLGLVESGREDPCMSNRLGYTRGIFDRSALRRACRDLARGDWTALKTDPRDSLLLEGSAARVAEVLLTVSNPR